MFLLCACASYAVSYAKPYRGNYSSGLRYTTSSVYRSSGFASAPVATMGSTSSYKTAAPAMSGVVTVQPVRGIYTAASQVRGGVTTGTTYGRMNGPRRTPGHPDDADECPYCHDDDLPGDPGYGYCDACGCPMDGCDCATDPYGPGYCWCPIGDGWQVWLFMAMLAAGYGCFVIRRREKVVKSEE